MARTLIRGGIVYTVDPELGDLPCGDVLLEDDIIAAVGVDLPVGDARIVDATNKIVLPGLVDTHRHLWQAAVRQLAADWTLGQYFEHMLVELGPRFAPEDVYVGALLGSIEALDSGITTIMDWAHIMRSPDHADEGVRGLREVGIRAVFGHGNPLAPQPDWYRSDVVRSRTDTSPPRTGCSPSRWPAWGRSSGRWRRRSPTSSSGASSMSPCRCTSGSACSAHRGQ